MHTLILRICLVLVIWMVVSSCELQQEKQQAVVAVLPQPVELLIKNGRFTINKETKLFFDQVSIDLSEVIQEYLTSITSYHLEFTKKPSYNSISFFQFEMPEDEYRINVSKESITISGGSNQAILYGFQSLRQILLMNNDNAIPALEMVDQPQFQWRGLLLDCSRHFMEKDFVKRYIDLLALYKMNVLHWHLTEDQGWRIEIDKYPKLTEIGAWRDDGNGGRYGGYYTKEDIREVVSYAEERGITIVPEIELPGHSQAALAAYPQLSCTGGPFEVETEWGVFKEIYCAGNDSTFIFLEDVLSEVMELFPSEYIHIGGDEVPKYRWEHCDKCQRRISSEGLHDEHELQSYFIGRIGDFLAENGRKMIGWDEILEGGLPDGATVQSWRGLDGARKAVQMGNNAIVSPTSHAYFDYGLNDIDLEKVYSFNPIPDGLRPEEAKLILGGECNMWSERAPQQKVDSKVFPRITAMSEVLWSGSENKDFDEFRNRLSQQYPMLDKLGVNYGFETVPVDIQTETVDKELVVSLNSYDSTLSIYYLKKGKRLKYAGPQVIAESETWAILFGKGNSIFKDTIYQHFEPHMANGLEPKVEAQFNANYTAGGTQGLTNGMKGSHKFRDGNWQGYWGDDIIATLDLGELKTINQLSSGFLQYNNAWIFFPVAVTYEISVDGINYVEAGKVGNADSPKNKEQKTQEYTLTLVEEEQVRFVRMKAKNMGVCPEWHDAAGSKAWLFIDEISVK